MTPFSLSDFLDPLYFRVQPYDENVVQSLYFMVDLTIFPSNSVCSIVIVFCTNLADLLPKISVFSGMVPGT